jgi:DNA invertase Pin-like site-specific DNA recombinase
MKVSIYCRVSTLEKGQKVEMQARELKDYCSRRGWDIVEEYVDEGISGAKDKRPSLDRMMADAHRRMFDAIVVWKFDRFARSTSHLLRALETFQALGIEFVSLTEGVDTSTPMGKMIFTVLGAVAELERSLIAERVRGGLRNAKAKGKRLGRPPVTASRDEVLALKAAGKSFSQIGRQLSISKSAAHSLAQSEVA